VITSESDPPDEISSLVGMSGDRSWRAGDLRDRTTIREKDNGWVVESGLPASAPLESHVDHLLQRLDPFVSVIKMLSERLDVILSCVVYAKHPNPGFHLDSARVEQIARLGAALDVDVYVVPDHILPGESA
jgi:hypothetical protein